MIPVRPASPVRPARNDDLQSLLNLYCHLSRDNQALSVTTATETYCIIP